MIRLTWRKCHGYLGQFREGNPSAFEWFEWLYDRLEQYPAPSKTSPAHVLIEAGSQSLKETWAR